MADIKSLREKQANIWTEARSKLDEITDDTPEDRAAEIEREFDAMMADYDKLGERMDRETKMEGLKSALDALDERAIRSSGTAKGVDAGDEITYRDAFRNYLGAQGNLGAMDARARRVLEGGYAKLPEGELRAQTTTTTAGGYTVPTEMASFIVKSMAAWGPMYDPGVTSEIMTSYGGQITIPTVDDTSVVMVQHTQGTTLTDDGGSDVTFGQKTLDAYAYNTEWLRVSKELVDDSAFNIEQFIGELLGERIARRVNTELTTGDGTGDPNGIVTASTSGVTAASSTEVTADELIDLLHSVNPAYRASPKCAFMANDTTIKELRKLKYGDGTYIIQRDFQNALEERLLGYRLIMNQAMPNTATGLKAILFGDLGKYYVRKVGSPLVAAIQDKDFWPGFGIAGYVRLDGELADTGATRVITML